MSEDTKKEATKDLPKNLQKIVDEIKTLSVLEVADLVKALEDEFGVSAAAPMMMAGAMPGAAAEAAEEKTEFDVHMASAGGNKIAVIKAVRVLKPELGLVDAKGFVEKAPVNILEGATKEDAEKAKAALEEAGATVELK